MEKESRLYKIRHSLAHVLAQAVQKKFPGVKLGFGPPVDHGFFYDFDFGGTPLTVDSFKDLEKEMRKIINEKQVFEFAETNGAEDALAFTGKMMPGQQFKDENVRNLSSRGESRFTFYTNGPFTDLCEGPHVEHTGELPLDAFKLDSIAGAYWLGSEKNPMLTRIYALAFETKKELTDFIERRRVAEQFDHKKLGKELDLFHVSETVGKGLILWLPNGAVIREEIEKYAKEVEFQYNYQRVNTPHITKKELYLQSQHLPAYEESMYPPMRLVDDNDTSGEVSEEYYLKPMNCPHHHLIFMARPHSYRDLPLRIAEYGTCYRFEKSGEVSGLIRVRCLTMNDAHIYIRADQFEAELKSLITMYHEMYSTFGLKDFKMRLSVRGPENREKYKGPEEMWDDAERLLEKCMRDMKLDFFIGEGEAAFYGPKIDIQFRNLLGREETVSTIQVDFLAAKNFDLKYTDENSNEQPVVVIHRAPLSTHERFISYLIEYYGGAFPTWCAPVQVAIIPIADEYNDFAEEISSKLHREFVRVIVDKSNNSFSKKIRTNTVKKIPMMLIIGKNEAETRTVTLRRYGIEQQDVLALDDFLALIMDEIRTRKMMREPMGALI
jgi:threonyl-tRNA synthetase